MCLIEDDVRVELDVGIGKEVVALLVFGRECLGAFVVLEEKRMKVGKE